MTDTNDPKTGNAAEGGTSEPDEKTPGDELREGLLHLFSAARKVIKTAEPHVTRSLDDAERVVGKIGRGGEVVATEIGKEVASLATRLAERLRSAANRADGNAPDERPGPEGDAPPAHDDTSGRPKP